MIAASLTLLLVGAGLLVVGLVTGATPVLVASVLVALAALTPLGMAVRRARPPSDPSATDPASGGPPADPTSPDGPPADPTPPDGPRG